MEFLFDLFTLLLQDFPLGFGFPPGEVPGNPGDGLNIDQLLQINLEILKLGHLFLFLLFPPQFQPCIDGGIAAGAKMFPDEGIGGLYPLLGQVVCCLNYVFFG
jgi:hypothetical protein